MKPVWNDPPTPAPRPDAGFSLTELAVVLVVFGILSAIALPGLNKFLRSLDLNGQVQSTASTLRVVRQRAITENNDYCVTYDTTARVFTWFDDENNDGVKQSTEKSGQTQPLSSWITVTQSVTNPFSSTTLIFYPNGSTNTSGSLIFSNSDGYTLSLSVVRPTGMVTVQ
jgi:prepilin-type N-terminal cleavage/methylation domain-containing protein